MATARIARKIPWPTGGWIPCSCGQPRAPWWNSVRHPGCSLTPRQAGHVLFLEHSKAGRR